VPAAPDPDAQIDRRSPIAESQQLVAILTARIERGDWEPGRPIPAEERLAQEYGLSRNTVRKAIRILVHEEALFVVSHRGTYVTERDKG
jgi:GntR family transcriptional regulator